MKQLFSNLRGESQFWTLRILRSKPKQQLIHPAQSVCGLAIDVVLYGARYAPTPTAPPTPTADDAAVGLVDLTVRDAVEQAGMGDVSVGDGCADHTVVESPPASSVQILQTSSTDLATNMPGTDVDEKMLSDDGATTRSDSSNHGNAIDTSISHADVDGSHTDDSSGDRTDGDGGNDTVSGSDIGGTNRAAALYAERESDNEELVQFVCDTFNAISIIFLHDIVITNEDPSTNSTLPSHFGRFLIHLLSPKRPQKVLDFVTSQMANSTKLYDVVTQNVALCAELLRSLADLYRHLDNDASDDRICKDIQANIRSACVFLMKKEEIQRQLVDHTKTSVTADNFNIAFYSSSPPADATWYRTIVRTSGSLCGSAKLL